MEHRCTTLDVSRVGNWHTLTCAFCGREIASSQDSRVLEKVAQQTIASSIEYYLENRFVAEEGPCNWVTLGDGRRICRNPKHGWRHRNPSFKSVVDGFNRFRARTTEVNYTFDPRADRGYVFDDEKQRKQFYKKYEDGKVDLVLIGATNNLEDLNRKRKKRIMN